MNYKDSTTLKPDHPPTPEVLRETAARIVPPPAPRSPNPPKSAAPPGLCPRSKQSRGHVRQWRGRLTRDVTAHMWFNLAAASGFSEAARNRDTLARQMTPAQIAEAQKLAREWKPK
jgi:transposase